MVIRSDISPNIIFKHSFMDLDAWENDWAEFLGGLLFIIYVIIYSVDAVVTLTLLIKRWMNYR